MVPSRSGIYWTVNNLLSMLQQWIINRQTLGSIKLYGDKSSPVFAGYFRKGLITGCLMSALDSICLT